MGTVTNSIGSAAGRDYSTVALWEAALPSNLVTNGNSYVGECYADSEFVSATQQLLLTGLTTDSTHFVTLKCATGHSFKDHKDRKTNALRYDASLGVSFRCTGNYVNQQFYVGNVPYTVVSGLQIKTTGTSTSPVLFWADNGVLENCIIRRTTLSGAGNDGLVQWQSVSGDGQGSILRNCILIGNGGGGIALGNDGNTKIVNNTIVAPSDETAIVTGIYSGYGSGSGGHYNGNNLFRNNAVFNASKLTDGDTGGSQQFADANSGNNAIDLGSNQFTNFGGSGNLSSKTYANQFVATAAATMDLRIKSGADLIDAGATETTNIPAAIDICNCARPAGSSWDIGAWEYVIRTVKSIGSAGGRDYSTIALWEAALPANLVTSNECHVGECYNDSEFSVAGNVVTLAGSTTDADHTITLKCASGQSFRDNASVRSNALDYNVSNGVGLKNTGTGGTTWNILANEEWVYLDGLQLTYDGTFVGGGCLNNSSSNGPFVTNCILKVSQAPNGDALCAGMSSGNANVVSFVNCLFIQKSTAYSKPVVQIDNGCFMYNCTLVGNGGQPNGIFTTAAYYHDWTIKNCAVFNCSAFGNFTGGGGHTAVGSNNATDLSSVGFGSNNQTSLTFANQFVSTTNDFRLKAGSALIDAGVSLTPDGDIDISKKTRSTRGSAWDIGAWEFRGTVTNSIGTSSRDYSTPALWEAALPANLIADANRYVGECYNDSEFTATNTNIIAIAGETTDATHTIKLTAASGQSFADNANVQINALKYDQSKGVGFKNTDDTGSHTIDIQSANVTISRLQVNYAGSFGGGDCIGASTTDSGTYVDQCICDRTQSAGGDVLGFEHTATVVNTIAIGRHNTFANTNGIRSQGGIFCYNCTFVNVSDLGSTGIGYVSSGTVFANVVFENCAIYGFSAVSDATALSGGVTLVYTNCSTDLGSYPGVATVTNCQTSKTYASQFINVTNASGDWRSKVGADLIDAGTTDTTNVPSGKDIANTTRPSGSSWDIGAWEFVQSGGGQPVVAQWDIPRPPRFENTLRTWAFSPRAPDRKPVNQSDWPLPIRRIRDTVGYTFSPRAPDRKPINQSDWPLPILRIREAVGYTFAPRAPDRKPINQFDWPLPIRRQGEAAITWNQQPNRAAQVAASKPVNQSDWPLPIRQTRGEVQTWTFAPRAPDTLPVNQDDWPLPLRRTPEAITYTRSPQFGAPAQMPVNQEDWPLPLRRQQEAITWTRSPNFAQQVQPMPANQEDWPLPIRQPQGAITWTQSPNMAQQVQNKPVNNFDGSIPIRPQVFMQAVQLSNIVIQAASVARPVVNIDLSFPRRVSQVPSWFDQQTLALHNPALPANQDDWPLPIAARRMEGGYGYIFTPFLARAPAAMPPKTAVFGQPPGYEYPNYLRSYLVSPFQIVPAVIPPTPRVATVKGPLWTEQPSRSNVSSERRESSTMPRRYKDRS